MATKILNLKCLHSLQSKISVVLPQIKNSVWLNGRNSILKTLAKTFTAVQRGNLLYKAPVWLIFGISKCWTLAHAEESLRNRFNFIADVVENVASAVVCIEVKGMRIFTFPPPKGSGFIIRDDGLILTNAHVVLNRVSSVVDVKLEDGRMFSGIVEDIDVKSDLATVRIKAKNLPVMKLGSSANVRPGEWVVAIGSPLSLTNTITSGVISSAHRQSYEIGIHNREMEYIQTDASITFGNSGGPLVNLDGEAIGINCMKISGGISFAIPIDYAKDFLKKTEENRSMREGGSNFVKLKYAGVTVFSLTPNIIQEMKYGEYHVPQEVTSALLVGKVVLGSPAYYGGLKMGDLVTHINSSAVKDVNNIYRALESGKPFRLTVLRKGVYKDVTIIPEDA